MKKFQLLIINLAFLALLVYPIGQVSAQIEFSVIRVTGHESVLSQYGDVSCPIHPGNIWVWRDWYGDFSRKIILNDSVKINGKYFYQTATDYGLSSIHVRLDSSGYYEMYKTSFADTTKLLKYYKHDAKIGDLWKQQRLLPRGRYNDTLFHVVLDTLTTIFYNFDVHNVKKIHFYGVPQTLENDIEYWSDEYGLIHADRYDGGPIDLWAARINGKDYGNTRLLVDVPNDTPLPLNLALSQNYPNPFNPVTKIRYVIPVAGRVKLNVYTVLGELLQTLINEEQDAAKYDVSFNASALPSGIYFYELQFNTVRQVKKMVLLK